MNKIILLLIFTASFLNAYSLYYYESGKKVYVEQVISGEKQVSGVDYYKKIVNSTVIGVDNKVMTKLNKHADIYNILSKYNVEVLRKLGDGLYLLKVLGGENVFETAAMIHEDSDTVFAQPNFIKQRRAR